MKCALITTTINIPHVLKLYRACGPDVRFFVAGDLKTPLAAWALCDEIGDAESLSYPHQSERYPALSELIGWNTISRRNIALLEALKWGAEIIVTIDDDNIPMSTDYFDRFKMVLGAPFSGLSVQGEWFDAGVLLTPAVRHRGFPDGKTNEGPITHVVDAKIGVAAGLCLGDPDIGACERTVNHPQVHSVTELGRSGVAVDPSTKTVFNSQNTAFLRELAPCFLMCPQFGRYDDIFASLIAQRVMRERDLHVHFGQPFVWQQRNPHDLVKDLKAELWGMEHAARFADWLDDAVFPPQDAKYGKVPPTPINMVRAIYRSIQNLTWMPPGVSELGLAWCEDVEKVL